VILLLGRAKRQQGDYEGALKDFKQQLGLAEEVGDQLQQAFLQEGIGNVLTRQERYTESLAYFQQSFAVYKSLGMQRGAGNTLANQANVLWQLGHYEDARARFDEARAIVNQTDQGKPVLTDILQYEGEMELSQRQFPEAKKSADEAIEMIGKKTSPAVIQMTSLLGLAQVFSGAKAEGRRLCQEAVEMASNLGDPWLLSTAQLALSDAEFETGDFKQSLRDALAAQQSFAPLGQQESEWRAWLAAARASRRAGDDQKAREYASRIPDLLSGLQQRWGAESYNSYLTRPDVQLLRKLLQDEFAISI
jgi:tetratricopeptide (TPR) repeat protein